MNLKAMDGSKEAFPESILCHCDDEIGCWDNQTCRTTGHAACYHFIEEVYDEQAKEMITRHGYGCLPPEEGGSTFQCHGHLSPHYTPKSIACCFDSDYCNKNITPKYHYFPTDPTAAEKGTIDSNLDTVITVVISCLVIGLILVVAAIVWCCLFKRTKKGKKRWVIRANDVQDSLLGNGGKFTDCSDGYVSGSVSMDQSSGSGSGMPQLVQRTIARQLQLEKNVGKGRFGEVYMAHWHGEEVAVKVFQTTDEASWKREKEIYQTMMLRHENILCFIAADISGTGGTTHMLLISAYHEHGSLHDYLKSRTLDYETTCNLAYTAAAGLAHLHVEIHGTEGKPGIAHRDIKSKNILVKKGGVCVIADFGLAVRHSSVNGQLDIVPNPRQGTIRYMAPEVLNKMINEHEFEAYKRADMYAFGLVMWEIATRCIGKGNLEQCPYKLPYEGMVPSDPSFDAMRNVVCKTGDREGCRPPIYDHWLGDIVLTEFAVRMEECWHSNPHNRLTALNVKKKLTDLKLVAENCTRNVVSPSPPPTLYDIV